jgi:hypothetical protein
MRTDQIRRFSTGHGMHTLALLLAPALFMSACGGALPISNGAGYTPAGVVTTVIAEKPTPNAIPAPPAQHPTSTVDCTAIYKANTAFGMALAPLVNLTPTTDYAALTDPASPVYLDFAKLRGDLNTLATLPDPTDATEVTFGKPSESVAYFRQVVAIGEGDIKAQGKPFNDTSATGQKVIGIDTPWLKYISPFGLAMDKACPGFTLPTDPPASNQVTNQIGQTATLGDLHVTLDQVVTVPGEGGNLPTAGNRFVFVSVTIENTGTTPLATNAVAQSSVQDAAGKQYGLEPNAIMLSASHPLNGEVAPGEKTSGTIGYQLPTDAGDLIWSVADNAPHRAVFAIKASAIVTESAPIDESTAAALQTSIAATTAAIIEMVNNEDATNAALTATPTP